MQQSVAKILKNDNTTTYTFAVTYTDLEDVTHNYNVFTDAQFRQIVKQMFGSRTYNDWEDETTEAQCRADFAASFLAWKSTRADTYARRMYALDVKFNPLENYRSHEEREGSFTHGESVELSFEDRKDTRQDDTYTERTYDGYQEHTTDDSFVEHSYTNYKETTKDDSYVERSYDQFKETTKDDSTLTRSYNQYKESTQFGAQTTTNKISADDSSSFVNSAQTENAQHTDDKTTTGSYTDEHGYDSIGNEKATTGSYKDQNGFDTLGNEKSITGSYKDQHGQSQFGRITAYDGSYKDEHGFTAGDVLEKSGTETTAHTGTDTDGYTLERYGNIGVTTSQQMLASDLDLLRYDITMTAIREFISGYTYLSCEVD